MQVEPDELPLLHPATKSVSKIPGKGLSSHGVAPIVLSALRRFTTVFGTGTGGTTALYHQGILNALGAPPRGGTPLNLSPWAHSVKRIFVRLLLRAEAARYPKAPGMHQP